MPKGRHEITEVQLQATRAALSARTAQGIVDNSDADLHRATLEEEIARRQLQLDELLARAAIHDAELATVQAEKLRLLDELARLEAELATMRATVPAPRPKRRGETPVPAPVAAPSITELAREEVLAQVQAHLHEEVDRQRLETARLATIAAFAGLVAEGRAEIETRESAAVVRIPTRLLFQEGFTTLSPRGAQIVAAAAEALKAVPGRQVTIEGHTDDRPLHTAEFASNWERAFSRAVAVLRGLEGAEAPASLSVASFAGTRPLVPNDSDEQRELNNRVELVIEVDPAVVTAFEPTPPPPPPEAPEPEP